MVQEKGLNNKRLFLHSITSLTDQAMLSALNLLVGLVLIRLVTKEAYGLYSQIYIVGVFASTIIEALVTSPLTTIAPGKTQEQREQLFAQLHHLQLRLNIGLSLLFGLGTAIVVKLSDTAASPWLLGVCFAVYLFFNAQREYLRSINFIQGAPNKVFMLDGAYVVTVGCSITALVLLDQLTIPFVMLALGCANIMGLLIGKNSLPTYSQHQQARQETLQAIWQRGKWALPGAIVAGVTNYSYIFLAAAFLGITASADLNAAKLLLMPISLCVLAWSRVARPIASRLYMAKNWQQLNKLAWVSVISIECLTLAYIGILWLMLPWLQTHVLGPQYLNISPLVLAWGLYFAINAARWIGSSWLISNDKYQQLLVSDIACMIVMFIACLVLIPHYGAWGAIASLIVVELFNLFLIWVILMPRARRQHA